MIKDLKTWAELTKNVIKNGFDKTIEDLTLQILKDSKNSKLYFYRTMLDILNANFEDADIDIENAKKYCSELPLMKDYLLKSGLIFAEYVENNPDIDYAEKFINLNRAEYSCNLAFWEIEDKETKLAVRNIKQLQKEFKRNNKENRTTLRKTLYKMYKLYQSKKYERAIDVGNNAIKELGRHPHILSNMDAISKKIA